MTAKKPKKLPDIAYAAPCGVRACAGAVMPVGVLPRQVRG